MTDIPEGFERNDRTSPLTDPWEPIWRRYCTESVQLGLRVAEAHCNGRGFAHGGLIASLADNAMGLTLGFISRLPGLVTVHLSVDYVRSVQRGQWLQVEPRVVRLGKSLGFVDALITADAEIAARANAVFRVVS
ncbi:MAG TPA: PaaI family thioesterase [Polyangiales bacterium]|jgi:uncharacterized protein (TIGR00369 family)|nr:PaaI family thioesterase [Polyangiales bacterium]